MAEVDKFLTKINAPESFGPGYWRCLHIMGLDANIYDKKIRYIHYVELILSTIPCLDPCRKDALSYLKDHPLTNYWDYRYNNEDLGMFKWSVDFHNWVNRKLNKIEIPFETALRYYRNPDSFVCTEGCGDHESKVVEPEKTKTVAPIKPLGFFAY